MLSCGRPPCGTNWLFLPVVQETMSVKNSEGRSLQLVHTITGVEVNAIMGVDEHINTGRKSSTLFHE